MVLRVEFLATEGGSGPAGAYSPGHLKSNQTLTAQAPYLLGEAHDDCGFLADCGPSKADASTGHLVLRTESSHVALVVP